MISFLITHNLSGISIAICTFIIIGCFHPLVVKAEYYIGVKSWWIFLFCGIAGVILSLYTENIILSTCFGVFGASCFWSILEVFEQKKRVDKGWFPKNPKKNKSEHTI
jgi:branched-subunit amino acid transport protein